MAKKTNTNDTATRLWLGLLVVVLGALGVLGWRWQATLEIERIDVVGARYAERAALLELARVDTGAVLFDVDPALIADRVRRHPWVAAAEATRLPTGTLRIAVAERRPVALALDESGLPSHYLDATGHQMPLTDSMAYDVPLVRGLTAPYHPIRRAQPASVRKLLGVLNAPGGRLISEIEVLEGGGLRAYVVPPGGRSAVPVRLGRDDFRARLKRLHVFWQQAVLPQSDKTFHSIDLRFDGQIVTREEHRASTAQAVPVTAQADNSGT